MTLWGARVVGREIGDRVPFGVPRQENWDQNPGRGAKRGFPPNWCVKFVAVFLDCFLNPEVSGPADGLPRARIEGEASHRCHRGIRPTRTPQEVPYRYT